jgi:hypothetical protein
VPHLVQLASIKKIWKKAAVAKQILTRQNKKEELT